MYCRKTKIPVLGAEGHHWLHMYKRYNVGVQCCQLVSTSTSNMTLGHWHLVKSTLVAHTYFGPLSALAVGIVRSKRRKQKAINWQKFCTKYLLSCSVRASKRVLFVWCRTYAHRVVQSIPERRSMTPPNLFLSVSSLTSRSTVLWERLTQTQWETHCKFIAIQHQSTHSRLTQTAVWGQHRRTN